MFQFTYNILQMDQVPKVVYQTIQSTHIADTTVPSVSGFGPATLRRSGRSYATPSWQPSLGSATARPDGRADPPPRSATPI